MAIKIDEPFLRPEQIVRHYWKRIPILIIGTVVALGAGIIYAKFFVGFQFESSATLMVRTPISNFRPGKAFNEIDPPVYSDILANDQIIYDVITAAREEFPSFPQANWEKMAGRFSVQSLMTRDTSVTATYSPVLELTTTWNDRDIAKYLMDTWLELIQTRYGQLRVREAQEMRDLAQENLMRVEEDLEQFFERQAALERQLAGQMMDIRVMENIIIGRDGSSDGIARLGLEERIVELELDATGEGSSDERQAEAALARAKSLLSETKARLADTRDQRSQTLTGLEKIRGNVASLRSQANDWREVLGTTLIEDEPIADPLYPEESEGDLILLSRPVQPEAHVGQSRGVFAAIIFILLELFLVLMLLVELILRRSLEKEESTA